MFRSLSSVFALGLALTACGTTTRGNFEPQSAEFSRAAPIAPAPPSEPASPGASMSSSSKAASAEAKDEMRSSDQAGAAAPSRPGLGTEWGETRTSRVSSAPFERNDWNRPATLASLFYNDAEGVRSMTRGGPPSLFATSGLSIEGGALTLRLLDSSGAALPTYAVGARTYVLGSAGERYLIEIQNHTNQRFEALATVDGLDVIDGRPGNFEKRGYLIGPWATLDIEGFRQSNDEVAAFRFGSVRDSYAARKGDDRNVGVIGVAFFGERGARSPLFDREADRRHDADPFPGRFATPPP